MKKETEIGTLKANWESDSTWGAMQTASLRRGEDVYGMMYGMAVVALPTATVFSHLIQAAQRHDFIELVTRP